MLDKTVDFSPKMQALLHDLAPCVVVVGSVARGKPDPKDLDLIYSESETALNRVARIVRKHGIPFESFWPGNWCFRDHNNGVEQQIEILPFHHPLLHRRESYRKCRRAGRKQQICGVEFFVAPPEYA
jgi:hypothetical protein